jgi:hypothetical protein
MNARAGVTNEPRRLSPNVDMRSVDGRRFTDIYDALSLDHPGADSCKLREVTVLKFELEKAQAAGKCTLEDVVRVHNLINRYEKALRLETRRKAETAAASPLSFRDKLMARRSSGGTP